MHVDLDAFFASVEQRDKPSLRGKPVVVGGIGTRGVVATASYEARAFGIHSAMSTRQARQLCGHAAYLSGRFEQYSRDSRLVMEVLRELSPLVEPLSLDEAFIDLGELEYHEAALVTLVEDVQTRIQSATDGLTASVGLGPNKLMAKIATEFNKPDGYFIVAPGTETSLLEPLSVRALPGIGPAAESRLYHLGITQVGHALAFEESELQELLGVALGSNFYAMIRAIDHRKVEPHRMRKSISVEDTFDYNMYSIDALLPELHRLVKNLAQRAHNKGIYGRTVTVKLRDGNFHTITRSATLPAPSNDLALIEEIALRVVSTADFSAGIRLVGVGLTGLTDWSQDALFQSQDEVERMGDFIEAPAAPTSSQALAPTPHGSETTNWRPGMDVHHVDHGDGWVWGSGMGLVTVRFETRNTPPGKVLTLKADDPELKPGRWDTF